MNFKVILRSVRYLGSGRFFATIAVVLLAVACSHDTKSTYSGETQGSYYSIACYGDSGRGMQPVIDSVLNSVDATLSLWNDTSLLRRINEGLTDSLNPLFDYTLRRSLEMNAYTNGAFDCRVGRLVQAWGFSFKQREELAAPAIDSLLLLCRGELGIAAGRLVRTNTNAELDFNAIAQGVTSDAIATALRQRGVNSFMIDVGGEVVTGAPKPDGSPWLVGIESPAANRYAERNVETVIGVSRLAIVTSGSYRKYYEKDGLRYSHTIDPSTGRPVSHNLLSATVVADSAWRADAYATAFMVMGLDSALAFIAAHPDDSNLQRAYFIYATPDGGYSTYATPQFEQLIAQP